MAFRPLLLLPLLLGCATGTRTLTVSYRIDDRCAPLYAACLNSEDFRARYGIWLAPIRPRELYSLRSGLRPVLNLKLDAQPGDQRTVDGMTYAGIPLAIVAPEPVMRAVLDSFPVRIIAPLQSRSSTLVIGPGLAADSWPEFVALLRAATRPLRVGYVDREPMALLAFEQAIAHERLETRVTLLRMVDYPPAAQALAAGTLDALLVANPAAYAIAAASGSRIICELHDLPPNRFENHPATVIAATDSAIQSDRAAITSFLELMACATHYANTQTARTRAAAAEWLGLTPEDESACFSTYRFASLPDWHFRMGLWNWYFALRDKGEVPPEFAGLMNPDDWYGIPYDSTLIWSALERAGRRIIR